MTARIWQTSTALRGNAFIASADLLLIADQGSQQDNVEHAEAVERLIRELRAIEAAPANRVASA